MKPLFLIPMTIMLVSCGSSAEQLTATADMAKSQTQVAAPTLTPIPTLTPTLTSTPTLTPTPLSPTNSPTPTPIIIEGRSTSRIFGQVTWEITNAPIRGVGLLLFDKNVTTDRQGNFSIEVEPGSSYVNLLWQFTNSNLPCPTFTLLGEWGVFPLAQLNAGGYLFTATSLKKLQVVAGQDFEFDILFSCQ